MLPPYIAGEDPRPDYIPDYPVAGGGGRENWNGEISEGEVSNLIEMIQEAERQGKLYIDYCGDFSAGVRARDFERPKLEIIKIDTLFGLESEWTESSLERYVREEREKAGNKEWFDSGYANSDTLYVLMILQAISGLVGGSQSGGYGGNQTVMVTPDGSVIIGAEVNAGALAGLAGMPWMQGKDEEKSKTYSYENGTYEKAGYHSEQTTGRKNPAPQDGQFALDNSVSMGENTTRRIGLDSNGDFVILDETTSGVFHGHTRGWNSSGNNQGLTQEMKNALYDAGYIKSPKGSSFKLTDYAKSLINN